MKNKDLKTLSAIARKVSQNIVWLVQPTQVLHQIFIRPATHTLPEQVELAKTHLKAWLKYLNLNLTEKKDGFEIQFDSAQDCFDWWKNFGYKWNQNCIVQPEGFAFPDQLKKSDLVYLEDHPKDWKEGENNNQEFIAFPPPFFEAGKSELKDEFIQGGADAVAQGLFAIRPYVLKPRAKTQVCLDFPFWEWLPQPHAIELFLTLAGIEHCRSTRNTLTLLFNTSEEALQWSAWILTQTVTQTEHFPWLEAEGLAYEAATVWNWTRNGFGFSRFLKKENEWHIHLVNRFGKPLCNLRFDDLEQFYSYREQFTRMAYDLRPELLS